MQFDRQHVGVLVFLTAIALILAGCGGSSIGSGHTTVTTTIANTTTTTTTTTVVVTCPADFDNCKKCISIENHTVTKCVECQEHYRLRHDDTGKEICWMSRGDRLCKGGTTVLWHQTTMEACQSILRTGFDMGRAKAGNQGMGAYFADTAEVTGSKTRHTGCVIKLLARLGNVFDMGEGWLPDIGRGQDGCNSMLGYKLMNESFDSVTTIKHGRERALFFDDQVLDMVAYPCPTNWGNHAERVGDWINGRSELKTVDTCDPDKFPEITPPPCKFDGTVERATCAGFTSAGCYTLGNGNVDDAAKCTGAPVLKKEWVDWNTCQKDCFNNTKCKGLQFGRPNECIQYSREPSALHAENSGYNCMKKVPVPGGSATLSGVENFGNAESLVVI